MKVGYVRVSSQEQNTARQEVLMKELEVEKVFIDKISGKNKKRKQLNEMMSYVREGDVVVVESISRFARCTRDLLELVDELTQKEVKFISKKESMDTSTASGKFMLTIFGAMAELEREYIRDRQKEGIEIAKKEGKYRGRKPIEIDFVLFESLYEQWKLKNITATKFMKKMDLKPNTFYRKIREYEANLESQQPLS